MDMLKRAADLLFKRGDFSFLMATQFLAQAGDGIVQVALAKLIVFGGQQGFDLEGARSPEELLRIVLYIFVPYTILSPFLGVVIDRWDRRKLLFVANGLRAVVIAGVALIGTGTVGDAPLFLSFLLTLASTRAVLATKAAALPATVDRTDLSDANAVSQMGGALFQLGGAGAAFIAAESFDAEPIVFVGALVYALGALTALAIKRPGEPRAEETIAQEVARVLRRIVEGIREVVGSPQAGAAITTYFWLRFLWSFAFVGIGFIARELLADDDLEVLVVTGGAGAAGAALGFLGAHRLGERRRSASLVLGASIVAGLAVTVLGPVESKYAIAVLTFFLGLGFFLAKISLDTMVQEALGDDFRGRAFSLYDIAYNLAWVLAAAEMKLAWTAERHGMLLSTTGLAFLLGIALIGLWFKRAQLLTQPVGRA